MQFTIYNVRCTILNPQFSITPPVFTVHHSLFTIHCSLFTVHRSPNSQFSINMSYTKNVSHNLLTQSLKLILGTLTGIIVARSLGPIGQGYTAYIILIFSLIGSFGHFGITNAVAYYQKKSGFERSAIYNTNINLLILISGVLSLIIYVLYAGGLLLQGYTWPYLAGGLILMISTLFTAHHQSWLMGDEKIIKGNRIALTVFFLKTACILLLWISGALNPFSFFMLTVAAILLWFILIQSTLGERYLPLLSLPVMKAEFSYGLIAWSSALFAYMHYRVDQLMIKQMLGVADLGVYSIAVGIAELLFLFPVAINTALSGRLYNLEPGSESRKLVSNTLRISILICAILCLIGFGGSFLIPLVYGSPYAEGTALMQILLPGVLFACLPKLLSPWWFSSGRPKVHLWITFLCLLMNLGLNICFIPLWGSRGAALASSLSYIFYGLYYLLLMRFKEGFSFPDLLLLNRQDLHNMKGLLKR